MWHYVVEPFGTARTFDGRRYFDYSEYRIFFRHNEENRGLFRLAARQNKWVSLHHRILRAYLAHTTGSKRLTGRFIHEAKHEHYQHFRVFMHTLRVGPIEVPTKRQLLFIDDPEGGCTGYCMRADLEQVVSALSDLWLVPPDHATDPLHTYLQLAPSALKKANQS